MKVGRYGINYKDNWRDKWKKKQEKRKVDSLKKRITFDDETGH